MRSVLIAARQGTALVHRWRLPTIIGAVRASPTPQALPRRWLPALCLATSTVSLLYLGALVFAGSAHTLDAIGLIGGPALLLGAMLCLLSLLLRCLRWQALLRWMGHPLPAVLNARIYVAGIALSATPAKLGETLRSGLLAGQGVPIRHSLAAFVADRAADVIGVALLGALCGGLAGKRQPILEVLAVAATLGSIGIAGLLRRPALIAALKAATPSGGRVRRVLAGLLGTGRAWAGLWAGWRPWACVALAMLVYGIQALIFVAFAQRLSPALEAAHGVAIFANATLIGAASLLPGGLGAMETALALQLRELHLAWPQAVAVVLATRLVTLWLLWLAGLAALASFGRWRSAADRQRL